MLFITNRALKQTKRSRPNRRIDFDLNNTEAEQSVYFCQRQDSGDYIELTNEPFFAQLKNIPAQQILLLIHGFSNLPEDDIFPRANALQNLFDQHRPNMVAVIPMIWPCDNDHGIIKDYWDDQKAADASAFSFSRALEKFMDWRNQQQNIDNPCLKRINVLAHSMGNRVLRETLRAWRKYHHPEGLPLLFRNTFLMAADIINESLERDQSGELISVSSRNVSVYFASDDLALRASKAANLRNRVASRRLGHTGPEDMSKVPGNVYAIDCDNYNTLYDMPKGHSYFLYDESGSTGNRPGTVFQHLCRAVDSGRVDIGADPRQRVMIL